jgi:hypothetical protein
MWLTAFDSNGGHKSDEPRKHFGEENKQQSIRLSNELYRLKIVSSK